MYITGIGHYAPERVLDNEELSLLVDTSDEWIRSRTGIASRHLIAEGQNCSDLAIEAARIALASSGTPPASITHVIVGTVSADAAFPATACLVQGKLGIPNAMSFDLSAACSGFLYGMQVARGLLAVEPEAAILLIGAEALTRRVNWQDRATCVLFGDGAGAAVLKAASSGSPAGRLPAVVEGILCESGGEGGDLLYCDGGGTRQVYRQGDVVGSEYFLHMSGQEVYKHAVRSMSGVTTRLMQTLGYTVDDIDLVVPHQANLRIIKAVLDRLGVPENKAFLNLDKYGNTSAASIPMALSEAEAQGVLRPGLRVLLTTFGAGLTWASAIIRY